MGLVTARVSGWQAAALRGAGAWLPKLSGRAGMGARARARNLSPSSVFQIG